MKNISFFLLILLLLVGFTTTSNMGLKIPSPGDTDYPTSISDSFTSVDQHDHTSGKGVQIPTGGIADSAITTAKLGANSVTQAKLAAKTVQISTSCGTVQKANTTISDITNLTVNITTTGRPVVLQLQAADGTTSSSFSLSNSSASFGDPFAEARYWGLVMFNRDGTDIGRYILENVATSTNGGFSRGWPSSSISYIDSPSAGTYTYKMRWALDAFSDAAAILFCNNVKLVAYEL